MYEQLGCFSITLKKIPVGDPILKNVYTISSYFSYLLFSILLIFVD